MRQPRLLTDGTAVVLRPIEPGDKDELQAGLHRLSPEAVHRRFQPEHFRCEGQGARGALQRVQRDYARGRGNCVPTKASHMRSVNSARWRSTMWADGVTL